MKMSRLRYLFILAIGYILLVSHGSWTVWAARTKNQTIPPIDADRPTVPIFPIPGRQIGPVILRGEQLEQLLGLPEEELFVYRYVDSDWQQIPFQIDEVTSTGNYTSTRDHTFDQEDEILFMAHDLGVQPAASNNGDTDSGSIPGMYEIQVTDPDRPADEGWAYVVHQKGQVVLSVSDYVDYNPGFHRIEAANYSLGLGATFPGADYLRLGAGAEVLDRTKLYIDCPTPFQCPINEDDQPVVADGLIADGPVRVILRQGQLLAYASMVNWITDYTAAQAPVRFSTDFNRTAVGATFYNLVTPRGVTVDGVPDFVLPRPFSRWWQLATTTGTLIHIVDLTGIRGIPRNYYRDDLTYDADDTGDHYHYGETGMVVEGDTPRYTYAFTLYLLPGSQPNLGVTYASYQTIPISVTISLREDLDAPPRKFYLPSVKN
jgi:hypothetical protein